jgi:NitT/TauT family transport system substrate-binding protein
MLKTFSLNSVRAAGCALLLVAIPAGARAADDVTLQLDWVPAGISAGWYWGLKNGCFTRENINLTITRGYGAGDAVTKIAAGASAFGITDMGVIIASRAKTGAPVKAIMPVVQESPYGILVLDDSPIKTMKDLEGHSIASAPSDATMQFLPYGMQLFGGDMAKVTKVPSEASTLTGLLLQGRVDAMTSYRTSVPPIAEAAAKVGKKLRFIGFGQELNIYNATVFTSDAILSTKADLVKRFRDGAACAYTGAFKDAEGSVDAMLTEVSGVQKASQMNMVPNSFRVASESPTFKKNGFAFDPARVAHMVELVQKAQDLPGKLNPDDFVAYIK